MATYEYRTLYMEVPDTIKADDYESEPETLTFFKDGDVLAEFREWLFVRKVK